MNHDFVIFVLHFLVNLISIKYVYNLFEFAYLFFFILQYF